MPKSCCAFGECKERCAPIIGDCKYCKAKYCAIHRLPEAHTCEGMKGCKEAAFNRNAAKLENERCVAPKV